MRKLVSLDEAATQLCVTVATMRDWRFRRKHLEFVKIGRAVKVLQSSIDRYIDSNTIPPAKR
jgi:hypothetical protein